MSYVYGPNSDFLPNARVSTHFSLSRIYSFSSGKTLTDSYVARKRAGYLALTTSYSRFYLHRTHTKLNQGLPDLEFSFNFWPTIFVVQVVDWESDLGSISKDAKE